MQMPRFTRLTNAFSKKIENHAAAVALWFAYYNFCRVHSSLRVTPAMETDVCDYVWSIKELCELLPESHKIVVETDKTLILKAPERRLDYEIGSRGLLTEKQGKRLFIVWLILLLPWIAVAPMSALAFDGPHTLSIYIGVGAIWSYPLSVGVVWAFRKKNPAASLFPCMNFVVFTIALFIRP